ncbi:MAG: hypothetical protein ABIS68_02900, partial [Casimicrobiaceae bacterium]
MHWLSVVALVAACGLCVPVYGQEPHAPQDATAAPVAVGAGPVAPSTPPAGLAPIPATTPAPVAQTPAASPTDPRAPASPVGINHRPVAGDDAA